MNPLLRVALALAALALLSPTAHAQAPEGNAATGHDLALKICSACHITAADQEFPPIRRPPAPAFSVIANRPATTSESLRAFLHSTHRTIEQPYNMPNLSLSDSQIANAAAYVLSLRTRR
jgi:mono/diheme cytochrome c family protein